MKQFVYVIFLVLLTLSSCQNTGINEVFLLETLFKNNDELLVDYNAASENNKQLVWHEEFDNNDSKWPIDTSITYSDVNSSIENGTLNIFVKNKDRISIQFPIQIDGSRNFEVETNIFVADTIEEQTVLLMVGNVEKSFFSGYLVGIDENMMINIVHTFLPKFTWKLQDYLIMNSFNTVTLRKIDNKYAFFINKKLFYILSNENLFCNSAYIYLYKGINKIDYCRVSHILPISGKP